MTLHCNVGAHWLRPYSKWSLVSDYKWKACLNLILIDKYNDEPILFCSMQISKLNVDKARHISIGKQKKNENLDTIKNTKAGEILCAHKCLPFCHCRGILCYLVRVVYSITKFHANVLFWASCHLSTLVDRIPEIAVKSEMRSILKVHAQPKHLHSLVHQMW